MRRSVRPWVEAQTLVGFSTVKELRLGWEEGSDLGMSLTRGRTLKVALR